MMFTCDLDPFCKRIPACGNHTKELTTEKITAAKEKAAKVTAAAQATYTAAGAAYDAAEQR